MKLSDFKNEEAIDVIADLIEPAAIIMADNEIAELARSGKPQLLIAQKALKKHKKEVVEIVAVMHRKDSSEVQFSAASLIKDILDVISDPELIEVFTSQGQIMEGERSGTVTENTTVNAQ